MGPEKYLLDGNERNSLNSTGKRLFRHLTNAREIVYLHRKDVTLNVTDPFD